MRKDSNKPIRMSAAKALAQIGKPSVPALIEAMNAEDPKVRSEAADALSGIGSVAREAIPTSSAKYLRT